MAMIYGRFGVFWRFWEAKNKANPSGKNWLTGLLAFGVLRSADSVIFFVIPVKTGIHACLWFWIPHQVRNDMPDGMFYRIRFEKTKPICRPLAGNSKHEFRNPKHVEGVRLKKQSQCQNRQDGVNVVIVKTYGHYGVIRRF